MSFQFTLSDVGFRLIKAYEGFAPQGRKTRDGRLIIGYGQLTDDPDENVSEERASDELKAALADYEALVNTHVHASMSQSQFDALCSLAYSIGSDAFLNSETLHALNRGEIISAANGFDSWRLGNIDGQVYVVDALVRRRTAEKALFLRPIQKTPPAPHETLKAYEDKSLVLPDTSPSEDRDSSSDAPSNIVSLYQSNLVRDNTSEQEDSFPTALAEDTETEEGQSSKEDDYVSPIALAANEVSEKLESLMSESQDTTVDDWPDSLVETEDTVFDPADYRREDAYELTDVTEDSEAVDTLSEDPAFNSADKYIRSAENAEKQNLWTFITMIILGLTAAGGGLWASFRDASALMGEFGPLIASSAVAIGVLLTLMGIYYTLKHLFGNS